MFAKTETVSRKYGHFQTGGNEAIGQLLRMLHCILTNEMWQTS